MPSHLDSNQYGSSKRHTKHMSEIPMSPGMITGSDSNQPNLMSPQIEEFGYSMNDHDSSKHKAQTISKITSQKFAKIQR